MCMAKAAITTERSRYTVCEAGGPMRAIGNIGMPRVVMPIRPRRSCSPGQRSLDVFLRPAISAGCLHGARRDRRAVLSGPR
ncbi:hypothetical protein CPBF426_15590 [Xanthomonas arboricola pv. juglandis]|nr:hypothetical protein CPBF426_15590 [Xanthomonas arboricola pv. juglandis]SYZ53786.1 hypothetical protein CPBF367_18630 [Xanthomonas arboricola pv. juglandis]